MSSAGVMSIPLIYQCPLCCRQHAIRFCKGFKAMNPRQRADTVLAHNMCFNCLGRGHETGRCRSVNSCKECGLGHHTMLHVEPNARPVPSKSQPRASKKSTIDKRASNQRGKPHRDSKPHVTKDRAIQHIVKNPYATQRRSTNYTSSQRRDSDFPLHHNQDLSIEQCFNPQRSFEERFNQQRSIEERFNQQRSIEERFNQQRSMEQHFIQQRSIEERFNQQRAIDQHFNHQRSTQQQNDDQRNTVINTIIESLAQLRDIM